MQPPSIFFSKSPHRKLKITMDIRIFFTSAAIAAKPIPQFFPTRYFTTNVLISLYLPLRYQLKQIIFAPSQYVAEVLQFSLFHNVYNIALFVHLFILATTSLLVILSVQGMHHVLRWHHISNSCNLSKWFFLSVQASTSCNNNGKTYHRSIRSLSQMLTFCYTTIC